MSDSGGQPVSDGDGYGRSDRGGRESLIVVAGEGLTVVGREEGTVVKREGVTVVALAMK